MESQLASEIERLRKELSVLKADSVKVSSWKSKELILAEISSVERRIERKEFKLWKSKRESGE